MGKKLKRRKPIAGQMPFGEIYKVLGYNKLTPMQVAKNKAEFAYTLEDKNLQMRLTELNHQIKVLKTEQQGVVKAMRHRKLLRNKGAEKPVVLYALKLEGDCYYVGCTYNVAKRFTKHQKGKGAVWTKAHPPIEIIETRVTKFYVQESAAHVEDDMTIEYAMKYGSQYVRGGGYCQAKPRWPDVIIQNELIT